MWGVRLLGDRLGTSDCTGNLPFKKRPDQNKTGPNSDIRDTKSELKKSVNSLVWVEIENAFEKNDCPEDFSRSSSGSPKANR